MMRGYKTTPKEERESDQLISDIDEKLVAVKTIKSIAGVCIKRGFIDEADIIKRVNTPGHKNILRLIGCVTQSFPLMIVVENAIHGNLKDFLIKNKPSLKTKPEFDITRIQQCKFASDIARGMEYLSALKIVHRGSCFVSKHRALSS